MLGQAKCSSAPGQHKINSVVIFVDVLSHLCVFPYIYHYASAHIRSEENVSASTIWGPGDKLRLSTWEVLLPAKPSCQHTFLGSRLRSGPSHSYLNHSPFSSRPSFSIHSFKIRLSFTLSNCYGHWDCCLMHCSSSLTSLTYCFWLAMVY